MTNLKMFIINAVLAAFVGALMQVTWALFGGLKDFTLQGIANMMFTGMLVGTVSLFCVFKVILRYNTKLKKAVIINIFIILLLLLLLYLQSSILGNNWIINEKWIIVLLLSEGAGISLTIVWYKQIKSYSTRLEKKKASLKMNQDKIN